MAYDPKAIANYFLDVAKAHGQSLSPMKLQKLVYFAQGWHLAIREGRPLIDEQVEAWKFGPVIPSLYRAFRGYGDQAITEPATYLVTEDTGGNVDDIEFREIKPSLDDHPDEVAATREFLDRIWDVYGGYSAIQLSNMTHQPGTPWDQINQQYKEVLPRGTDIPSESIRTYFRSLAKRN
jgi:uncharacterized phage-associated protein